MVIVDVGMGEDGDNISDAGCGWGLIGVPVSGVPCCLYEILMQLLADTCVPFVEPAQFIMQQLCRTRSVSHTYKCYQILTLPYLQGGCLH